MANHSERTDESSYQGRIVDFKSLLFKHVFLIAFTSIVGMGLGYLYFLRQPPTYESSCGLLVQNENMNQPIPFRGDGGYQVAQREQMPHAQLIASQLVIGRAVEDEEFGLKNLPSFAGVENLTGHILSRLTVRASRQNSSQGGDGIFELYYRDNEALMCGTVLAAIVKSYQKFLGERHDQGTKEVMELITDAEKVLNEQLRQLEIRYQEFREENPLVLNRDGSATNKHKNRMQEIEAARNLVAIELAQRRAELQAIETALKSGGSREALSLMVEANRKDKRGENDPKTASTELFPLMLEHQMLLTTLGEEHPKVSQLAKKIDIIRKLYADDTQESLTKPTRKRDFLSIYLDSIHHDIAATESKLLELDELWESERNQSKALLTFELTEEQFRKDSARLEKLYSGVVKRVDEISLLKDYGGYRTALISEPTRGSYVSPVFAQMLLIGMVLGAVAGLGLAYLAEVNDKKFRSPQEVSELLQLPIVGHTPVIEKQPHEGKTAGKLDHTLVTYYRPKSRFAESYRAIRTSLYFSTRGEQHKVIQITSPTPGDGKTTLAANLAISIAQSGKKVLLTDADFRRPRIHKLFGLDEALGMSSVISGDSELPDAIQATEVENLWCLPCGPRPNNPCELLTSRRFEELLEVLREQYDFVIIDTPPLLAVTDPSAVASRVDGILLTIRLRTRTQLESMRAVELLTAHGGNTLGVVVNGVGVSGGYGYGGYGYNYGYGYGYGYNYGYGTEDRYAASNGRGRSDENPYYAETEEEEMTGGKTAKRW